MVSDTDATPQSSGFRWLQLVMGIVCMAIGSRTCNMAGTLFVDPIDAKYHWGRARDSTRVHAVRRSPRPGLVPVEAWFVDKYGPRIVVMFGGIMIALAWLMNSYADSLVLLYAPRSSAASAPAPCTAPASANTP